MEANPAQSSHATKVSAHPLKAILLVDDNRELAESLQAMLIEENFLVDVAHDGAEALLKIRINEYDAVVTDLLMPKLSGEQLYQAVQGCRPTLAERFFIITGSPTDPTVTDFLARTKAKCLTKPFPIEKLIAGLRELLAQ